MSMVRDIFTQTLQFIKQHQDGETAELLRYRGLQYNMMYGVSSAILYSYAKKLEKNQELADMLWKEDFREAKLLALMLSDPNTISDEALENMVCSFTNHELVENASLYLLPYVPNPIEKAYNWIEDDREFVKMTGYMLVNKIASRLKNVNFKQLAKFVPLYERDFTHSSFFVRNAVANAFQEVAFRKPGLKGHIVDATKRVLQHNIGTEFELQAQDMLHVLNYC